MNAYDLQDIAFDEDFDCAKETIAYLKITADVAFDINLSDEVAQKILDCRSDYRAKTELNGEGDNNFYHLVKIPLESISI